MKEKTFTIIDGYGFLFRAYYVLHHLITTTGIPIGGVYGFLKMVLKYIAHSDYLTIAFDSGKKNFRHILYSEYKANRVNPPEDLIPQFAILREAVEAFNLSYEEIEGYEADDIIATLVAKYSKQQDFKVIIASSDKDLFQLLNYNVLIFDPIKDMYIDEKQVVEKLGVNSDKLLDLFSLIGDTSDNIPGIPGIGPKTGAKLLHEFGSLDNILENINNIKQTRVRNILIEHKEKALISRKLLSLCEKVDLQHDIEKYKVHRPNMKKLLGFLKKYEFNSMIGKVEQLFSYSKFSKKKTEYSSEELENFLKHCRHEGKIAIYCHFESDVLSKISLSYSKNNIFYISQDYLQDAVIKINSTLLSNGVLKVIHNVRKVREIFPTIEKVLCSVDDLMTMSYSLDTGKHNHSISNIIAHNLSGDVGTFSAKILIAVHKKLTQRLFQEKLFTIYERFDKPLTEVILNMEKNGILLNIEKLQELSVKFQQLLAVLKDEIYSLAGERFNIASPKQLSDVLFNKMGLNKKKKLKSGSYSTNFEVLEELGMEGVEIASKILDWRHLNKLKGTYTDALVKRIDPIDGRVHTNFSTTATGRLSSSNPNLQNIPIRSKEGNFIRQAFIAPKGYKIISADYSQIELRLLAHIADVAAFKEAFANGQDVHSITAKQVFGIQEDIEVNRQLRQKAKSINFGIIYGISPFGLARQCKITIEEAAEYINYYFSCYPEIKIYMEKAISIARQNGYVETLFGRRCFVKDIHNTITYLRQFAERAAINAPVQGTAADIIKRAMIQLYDQLKRGKIILQVHDELLVEIEDDKVQETAKLVKDIMENAVKISIPLEVEVKVSDNWDTTVLKL